MMLGVCSATNQSKGVANFIRYQHLQVQPPSMSLESATRLHDADIDAFPVGVPGTWDGARRPANEEGGQAEVGDGVPSCYVLSIRSRMM